MAVLVAALKIALSILCCVYGVTIFYTFTADYFASCFYPQATWWMEVAATDFFIYYAFAMTWYFYKESRWIMRAVTMLVAFWLGSCFICGYMVMLLFKLSREESLKDPLHFVFTRRQKGCMKGTLVDLCILPMVFSVWIAYKESSWITAFFFYILLVCFGSVTLCAYVARELFYLSPEQHVSLILFNKSNRDLMLRDPSLLDHSNV